MNSNRNQVQGQFTTKRLYLKCCNFKGYYTDRAFIGGQTWGQVSAMLLSTKPHNSCQIQESGLDGLTRFSVAVLGLKGKSWMVNVCLKRSDGHSRERLVSETCSHTHVSRCPAIVINCSFFHFFLCYCHYFCFTHYTHHHVQECWD